VIELNEREAAGIYLELKKCDDELDITLCRLLTRIEKELYANLSIQQLENLEELYLRGDELTRSRNGGKKHE
jgi:hypothetical protein